MRPLFLPRLLLGLLCSVPGVAHTQTYLNRETGTIAGEVTDCRRHPLPSAVVLVLEDSLWAATDSLGRFRITAVPVGHKRVRVVMSEYESVTHEVNVTHERETRCSFGLCDPRVLATEDSVMVNAHPLSWLPDSVRPNAGLDTIAAAVHAASRVGAYRLSSGDEADLDSTSRTMLERLLRDTAEDRNACLQYSCSQRTLGFRLKIYDQTEPIVIEVGTTCIWWSFKRGWPAPIRTYCGWVPEATQPRLKVLIDHVFAGTQNSQ